MKRLILAFDIGTTYSGASYAITEGRSRQKIVVHGVNRFTGKGTIKEDSKIPSCLLYNLDNPEGEPFRVGAEVGDLEQDRSKEAVMTRARCTKVEWFKLLLRPNSMELPTGVHHHLPAEKTVVDVYADYLKYLYAQTRQFLEQTDQQAATLLTAENTQFVLTHPNGWESYQQHLLRKAAKKAGLVENQDDKHLVLLTEGEASAHYCYNHDFLVDALEKDYGVGVIDAGGGTIDISCYRKSPKSLKGNLKLEEIAPAQCVLHGSVFVSRLAEAYINGKLKGSEFESDIPEIVRIFDESTKISFHGPKSEGQSSSNVIFGRKRDNSPAHGIENGAFLIPDEEMVKFFEPSINAIVQAMIDNRKSSDGLAQIKVSRQYATQHGLLITGYPKRVLLVGGFAANDWLYKRLKEDLYPFGIEVYRPDRHTSKAVADGAVYFCANRKVTVRVARATYGTDVSVTFNYDKEEHLARKDTLSYICRATGGRRLRGVFSPILRKGTQVEETEEFAREYVLTTPCGVPISNPLEDGILCYTGQQSGNGYQFMDAEPDKYEELLTYKTQLPKTMVREICRTPGKVGRNGQRYTEFDYKILISFGATELKARTVVNHRKPRDPEGKVVEKRFPAKPIYPKHDNSDDED